MMRLLLGGPAPIVRALIALGAVVTMAERF